MDAATLKTEAEAKRAEAKQALEEAQAKELEARELERVARDADRQAQYALAKAQQLAKLAPTRQKLVDIVTKVAADMGKGVQAMSAKMDYSGAFGAQVYMGEYDRLVGAELDWDGKAVSVYGRMGVPTVRYPRKANGSFNWVKIQEAITTRATYAKESIERFRSAADEEKVWLDAMETVLTNHGATGVNTHKAYRSERHGSSPTHVIGTITNGDQKAVVTLTKLSDGVQTSVTLNFVTDGLTDGIDAVLGVLDTLGVK